MSNDDTTIFVVDDDEDVRSSLQALLEAEGFAAETFESAGAFLASDAPTRSGCCSSARRSTTGWPAACRTSTASGCGP